MTYLQILKIYFQIKWLQVEIIYFMNRPGTDQVSGGSQPFEADQPLPLNPKIQIKKVEENYILLLPQI